MKHLLLAALLLFTVPALGQTTPTAGIEALDAKNGFRSYKFGTPINQLTGFEKRRDYYINALEPKMIGDVNLNELKFYAYDGKFSQVIFTTYGAKNSDKLLDVLRAQYGEPEQVDYKTKQWIGNKVAMIAVRESTTGPYGVTNDALFVLMKSKDSMTKEEADKLESAKKGAKDL